MKKLKIILATLFTIGLAFSFVSCDDLINSLTEEEEEEDDSGSSSSSKTLKKTFKLTQISGAYYYYSEVVTGAGWDYTYNGETHTDCIYQISFKATNSANTKGTVTIYTRPRASTTTIESIATGSWESTAPINADGTVTITYEDNTVANPTISGSGASQDSNGKDIGGTFTLDVYKMSSGINASDAK